MTRSSFRARRRITLLCEISGGGGGGGGGEILQVFLENYYVPERKTD